MQGDARPAAVLGGASAHGRGRCLRLELSEDKTLLTHARTGAASFLGYEVIVQHSKTRPRVNGSIGLRVPGR